MNTLRLVASLLLLVVAVDAPAEAQVAAPVDQVGPKPPTAVEQELRDLDRQWAELAVRGDVAAYDRLTDEHHIATHANGQLVTRAQERSYLGTSAARFAAIT